ncbi:hypothetical protein M2336_001891 [Sphingobium sp. B1D7B]|uniref:hypothetical protein n=1 Tax=Sphingobium TaxID=165695 RepID=UPI0015EB2CB6|nr:MULTISPECIES: hypothetical protein [Sphingobium]MCW2362450.1 hypothetical protein [Sphingobium sp. B10D3B]MCW2395177.1 hypothetical protein [Sphingobium sp. B8D3B]MCW2400870.1 hypothetical protein [Sphingobium sp. B10D7B]MCW2405262.1 hypothetical protein [Sphingobium sp. B1D7B]MCW2407849.1 hypothetical protein [Sphingobium xanthum]
MAKAYITRYSTNSLNWQRLSSGQALSVLGHQDGDGIALDLADGEQAETEAFDGPCLCRIVIVGGDAQVRIAKDADADTGELWLDGTTDQRYVRKGERIAIKRAA